MVQRTDAITRRSMLVRASLQDGTTRMFTSLDAGQESLEADAQ